MDTASKRLQAIRRQLLHMDHQYRSGIDEEDKTDTNANTTPEKRNKRPQTSTFCRLRLFPVMSNLEQPLTALILVMN